MQRSKGLIIIKFDSSRPAKAGQIAFFFCLFKMGNFFPAYRNRDSFQLFHK